MRRYGRMVLVAVAASSLAGCGGDEESEAEKEAESGRGTVTCSGDALAGSAGLPGAQRVTRRRGGEKGPNTRRGRQHGEKPGGLKKQKKEPPQEKEEEN